MSNAERVNYTDSLNCLMSKPAKTPSDLAPGAKTRYDDWVATHINQTLHIHCTVSEKSTSPPPPSPFPSLPPYLPQQMLTLFSAPKGKLPRLAPLVHLVHGTGPP